MSQKTTKSITSIRENKWLPFGKGLILHIVEQVESGCSRRELCANYGMAYSTLSEWMTRYGSDVYQSNKRKIFSLQQKRKIINAIVEKRMTKSEACLAHKINKKILNTWLLKCKREDQELVNPNNFDMNVITDSTSDTCTQKELTKARLKIKALELMIDIAEQQFKINIRKKSGAKQ